MIAPTHLDGAGRRDAVLDVLADTRRRYVLAMQRALLHAQLERGACSIDDVRDAVPLPPDIDPRCAGAVHLPLVRAGIIAESAYRPSARPIAHARRIITWILADAAGAERWLAEHQLADDDQGDRVQAMLW